MAGVRLRRPTHGHEHHAPKTIKVDFSIPRDEIRKIIRDELKIEREEERKLPALAFVQGTLSFIVAGIALIAHELSQFPRPYVDALIGACFGLIFGSMTTLYLWMRGRESKENSRDQKTRNQ